MTSSCVWIGRPESDHRKYPAQVMNLPLVCSSLPGFVSLVHFNSLKVGLLKKHISTISSPQHSCKWWPRSLNARGNWKRKLRPCRATTPPGEKDDSGADSASNTEKTREGDDGGVGSTAGSSPVNGLEVSKETPKDVQLSSGSPLPGVKPPNAAARLPKEVIEVLRNQIFGFDTFFVTGQEPYEGGVLFQGNLRGDAPKSYSKMSKKLEDKFGDTYKLFLLISPVDDKPVAVVVPKDTLQPDSALVPEWLAAFVFGLVSVVTILLRVSPVSSSFSVMSPSETLDVLQQGLPLALTTLAVLLAHEAGHYYVATKVGAKLGSPFLIPSWQLGCFGVITRVASILPKRQDLLEIAAAGPLAGAFVSLLIIILGFVVPPGDHQAIIVESSAFHDSLLVGGIAKAVLGASLKDGMPIAVNPIVLAAWSGLLINAINSIPVGELDGGRISQALWGRKVWSRLNGVSVALLGFAGIFNDIALYWVVLVIFLQRGPISPQAEEITPPDNKGITLGLAVLILGLLVYSPYPFAFS